MHEKKEQKPSFSGFSTGGGKKMVISEEQLKKAALRLRETT